MKYPDNKKEKTKNFLFCPENKVILRDKCNDYRKKIRPKKCTKSKKVICDWTDEKKYLIHYRMLNIYVRHGMIVEKNHEIISFKQRKWLERYINFITQKRNRAKIDFEKDIYKLLVNAAFGKFLEDVRNRLRLQFFKKDDNKNILKQQSEFLLEFINHMKIVIAIHSNKKKLRWINRFTLILLY